MDNTGFWPIKPNLPILNIGFENFWDVDEVIWEHYFKTSHCFLWEKYDVRYNPQQADVVFCSIFQRNSNAHKIPESVPRVLLIHEPFAVSRNPAYDRFRGVISFTSGIEQPNNIRIPYWVYRLFDQYASSDGGSYDPFNTFLFNNFLKARNPKLLVSADKFCAFVQGKSVPWRDQVYEWLNAYKPVDSGGSLFFNLPDGHEKDFMAQRLMGRKANLQKCEFFSLRKFGICMENTMDMPGYTTEKLIDAYFSGCMPIYAGQFDPDDGFNVNAFINLYDYGYKDAFMNQVIARDNNPDWETEMRVEPLFTKFPEQFGLDAMLDTYTRLFK